MSPYLFAIPVFFLLVAIELWVAHRRGVQIYRFQDTLTSMNIGTVSQFVNTIGGAISWWMGSGAHKVSDKLRHKETSAQDARALRWLDALGPKACLLSWLPGVGDPLCAVAGWLRLPFWPCVAYMAVGKFARYVVMTGGFLWVFPQNWVIG